MLRLKEHLGKERKKNSLGAFVSRSQLDLHLKSMSEYLVHSFKILTTQQSDASS